MLVSCFSAGVSSAIATKMMIDKIDHIIYQHVDDQHSDTLRFLKDCEKWFGKEIEIQRSPYGNVENVCLAKRYVRGPHGAPCTQILKRRLREEWEVKHKFFEFIDYVWGMDNSETKRALRLTENMNQNEHIFPLIEKAIDKNVAHGILKSAGIKRPKMYDLGYQNNNCVGCVKGGMGYWNKIRTDFPIVFNRRALMERKIGGTCIKGIYLDELDPDSGRKVNSIIPECMAICDNEDDEINH